jgi:hypothetical protein
MGNFSEAERKIYATDNTVAAGYDVARLNRAVYNSMADDLFDVQFKDIATAREAKRTPELRPHLDRFRARLEPFLGPSVREKVEQLLKLDSVREMTGICNAWSTMWIWNCYDNPDTIEDQPQKILCRAFQKYYQTTAIIGAIKGRPSASALQSADEKFMAKLKGYSGSFGLQVDPVASLKGNFPVAPDERYHGLFLDLARSISGVVGKNPGVGFKLRIELAQSAHAIGFMARAQQAIYLFDPNHGLYRYNDFDGFRSDVYSLFCGRERVYSVKGLSAWVLHALKRL